MNAISVAIPVLKGRTIFIVDKGRPWSVVEHLVLEALAQRAWTANELAAAANISRRVIVETYIRLMRAGWVELSHGATAVTFKANSRGIAASKYAELPSVLERKRRSVNFVVDLVVGGVFRNRDWSIQQEQDIQERTKKEAIVWIAPASIQTALDANELVDTLLAEDETFVDAEPSGLIRRYVVATVRDGLVEGLPAGRELPELRGAILAAAAQNPPPMKLAPTTFGVPGPVARPQVSGSHERAIHFDLADLVLDGDAHREIVKECLREAQSKVLIHSTFIDEKRLLEFIPDIEGAVQRGVRVHVFWGQSGDLEKLVSTQTALIKLRKNPAIVALGPWFVIHPFSTGSHAKLLIADIGRRGEYVAVVGSCNWLTSGFASYEVSVLLRDPRIVCDVVAYLSRLSYIHDGVWSDLASELVNISRNVAMTPPSGTDNALASVVVGAQHNSFVLRARDEAKRRAFITSHRLGPVSGPAAIIPLMSAAMQRGLTAHLYYCRRTAPIGERAELALVAEAAHGGVALAPVESPRLHAKTLAWDDNSILVTSLNWLSADPIELNGIKEIGIWIEADGVAAKLVEHFHASTGIHP